jgi:SNF2 family DNA or RNA helicase
LRWHSTDVMAMARIIGPELAQQRTATLLPSVLRLAQRHKLLLSDTARTALTNADADTQHARRVRRVDDVAPRTALERRAFPHQRVALHFFKQMARPSYLLADDVGVGKTLSSMLWAHSLRVKRVLVICLNSAKAQWAGELQRFLGQPSVIVQGTRLEQQRIAATRQGWVIGHMESLVHAASGYTRRPWDLIILDEAHYFQNPKAQPTETLFALDSTYRVALSAHPYARIDHLFSLLRFLYPERYTSFWRFFHQHILADPQPFGGFEIVGARRPKLLQWELAPFTLRRTRTQVKPTLPVIARVPRVLTLPANARAEYQRLRKQFFVELDAGDGRTKTIPILNALARTTRLRQYLVDPALIGGATKSVKYPEVAALLDEIRTPTVVFSMFEQAATRLAAFLTAQKKRVRVLSGKVPAQKREPLKQQFLRGELDALIVVTQAGSASLNLGRYGYVIGLDVPWTSRDLEQMEGRVDRPDAETGLSIPTTAFYPLIEDSYEERMLAKLQQGKAYFQEVFTVNDLKELFA